MLVDRMIRAARLDPDVYHELQRDQSAIGQAFLVVMIAAACGLVGAAMSAGSNPLWVLLNPFALFGAAVGAIGSWLVTCCVGVVVAARMGGREQFDDVMRPLAFTFTPGVLHLLGIVPNMARPVSWVVFGWTMLATYVAVREIFRFNTQQTVLTMFFTLLILGVVSYLTGMTFNGVDGLLRLIGL
jgi:Yip1-like protein